MYVLSICIPTFNRAAKLNSTLEAISKEIRGLPVEICISDNGSADDTQKVISKWKHVLPISSRKNETNMGYDMNMVQTLWLAEGEFAMCCGDDDAFVEGSLARLVADLSSADKEVGAVYLNSLKNGVPVTSFDFTRFSVFRKDGDYAPLALSFGGAICLRTKVARDVINEKIYAEGDRLLKREADTLMLFSFVHTYLFLECCSRTGSLGIEPSCVVRILGIGQTISITKRFFFDLIFNIYYLQIRMKYPWIKESIYLDEGGIAKHIFKRYFALAYMLNNRPDLKDAFRTNYAVSLKILKMNNRFLAVIFQALAVTRVLPLIGIVCIDAYKAIFGRKDFLSENTDNVGIPSKSVDDFFTYARKYQGV